MSNHFTKLILINEFTSKFLTLALASLGVLCCIESSFAASIEIGFLIDGSSSVQDDFDIQRDSYVRIFSNNFVDNFLTGDIDTVFASFWQFSDEPVLEVGWSEITTDAQASSFANNISSVTHLRGGTDTADAINTVTESILNNGINSDFQVIDVSSDGIPSNQADALDAASNAFSNGIITNTLFVGTNDTGISNLADIANVGGGISFNANSFVGYEDVLIEKLESELFTSNPDNPDPDSPPNKIPESSTSIGLISLGFLLVVLNYKST